MNPLLEAAHLLAATLPAHRASHDAQHQLDPAVVDALRATGMLTCLLPRALGGGEFSPPDYVALLATLAAGDPATAWCVMTASTSTLMAPYLPRATAEAIWGGAVPFLAGVFAPTGKATADGDGVRLSGRWAFTSGSRHADWFAVGALTAATADAPPRHVVCFVPARDGRVVDNWDTLGLHGTGSHDLVVEDARVPASHVTSVFDRAPWADGPLYRVPLFGLLAVGIAACGLGIAHAALAEVATKLAAPASSGAPGARGDGPPSTLLHRYAELRARLDAARAYLTTTAAHAATAATAGALDGALRGELRLAASFVAEQCAEVVRAAFHLGGGASIRAGSPLGAALRDVETMLTHRMVADRVRPAAARALLGVGPVPADL